MVLPVVKRVHVSRRAANRASMAVFRVPIHAQTACRTRGAGLPKCRAQEGAEAPGKTGVRGHLHDRGQRLGGRTDIRTDHYRADIGEIFIYYFVIVFFFLYITICNNNNNSQKLHTNVSI